MVKVSVHLITVKAKLLEILFYESLESLHLKLRWKTVSDPLLERDLASQLDSEFQISN